MDIYKTIREWDLFLIIALLCIIGLASLHSASYTPDGVLTKDFAKSQFVWILFSAAVAVALNRYGYVKLLDKAYLLFAINIALLLVVFFIGALRLGARRWLSFGFFQLQPSELCKVTFILALVRYASDIRYRFDSIHTFIVPFAITFLPMIFIIKQPDLGTALTLLPVFFIVLFSSGTRKRYIFWPIAAAVSASPFLWNVLKQYQKNRILVFLNPDMDPLGAGYTVIQSKIAIGSGGFFGKGWMSGTQNQLNFLPERHTDFIFSVIGEEWGFVGAAIVLVLFLCLLIRLLRIADTTSDEAGKLTVMGIVALLWFEIAVNAAMVMGLMPTVGLPLPFLTYGGSNLLAMMALVGIAKSVEDKRKVF
ncbi:MAG: rod shape-determining protein RodA [Candidatus Omnitrophota bacterium]